jgi:hypothetical protein
MEEIQQDYTQGATDPEATLVQPRFDVAEEQTAQPVVPLTRTGASWQRRRLPLVLVSALVGGLVSVVAYRLYQRAAQPRVAQQVLTTNTPQPGPSPELTAAAPAKDDAAPVKTTAAPAPHTDAPTEEAKPTVNEAPAARAAIATGKSDEKEKRAEADAAPARIEKRNDEGAPREDRQRGGDEVGRARRDQPRARRVDVITSPDAERVVRERHRGDSDATDNPSGGREGRHEHRVKGRNIDRIRDIFGAPPPA